MYNIIFLRRNKTPSIRIIPLNVKDLEVARFTYIRTVPFTIKELIVLL